VLKTNITFVRIDDEGNPIPISDRVKTKVNLLIGKDDEILINN